MRRLLFTLFILFIGCVPAPSWGAIAYVGGNSGDVSGTTDVITITYTTTTGNCIVVGVSTRFTGQTVSSITDTGGSTYTYRASIVNGNMRGVEIWSTGATGAVGSTTITITLTDSTSNRKYAHVAEYSGVAAIGTTATNSGNSANPTVSLVTQDANNYVVAMHGIFTGVDLTATVGTRRLFTSPGSDMATALLDNTNASATTVTTTSNESGGSFVWAVAGVELRSTAGASPGYSRRTFIH